MCFTVLYFIGIIRTGKRKFDIVQRDIFISYRRIVNVILFNLLNTRSREFYKSDDSKSVRIGLEPRKSSTSSLQGEEEAFIGAGQRPGIEIWRVVGHHVVKQDESTHGHFYSAESYIVLMTKQFRQTICLDLEMHLHVWLGKNSTKEKKRVAVAKTVELYDLLHGWPIQSREVQDHESTLFLSYFKPGIRYLEGEAPAQKQETVDSHETRLWQIKGKRNARVRQVACDCSSLNQGDVFILDCGQVIYVWNGPKSSKIERMKGVQIARKVNKEDRKSTAIIKVIDKTWEDDPEFFTALGSGGSIKSAEDGGDDLAFERFSEDTVKLYKVAEHSGQTALIEVAETPLKYSYLDSKACFILDSGPSGIYIWIGLQCNKSERHLAWEKATEFMATRGYADWTHVTQVVEGAETPLFKQYFLTCSEKSVVPSQRFNNIKTIEEEADTAFKKERSPKRFPFSPDNGSGTIKVWKLMGGSLVLQSENTYGYFVSKNCYIIQHTSTNRITSSQSHTIYIWQGEKTLKEDRGSAFVLVQKMNEAEYKGTAIEVRVFQGNEPEHLTQILYGKLIVYMDKIPYMLLEHGSKESSQIDASTKYAKCVFMFRVESVKSGNMKAVQVPARAESLNTNDVFLVDILTKTFQWNGQCSDSDLAMEAMNILHYIFPDRKVTDVVIIDEGRETSDFWKVLGGQAQYTTEARSKRMESDMPSRLFHCSDASGRFKVEEIVDFRQQDLYEDDVMMLDTFNEARHLYGNIYIWIGRGANEEEKKEAITLPFKYLAKDPAGRNEMNTLIVEVKQGFEPTSFTNHFPNWDTNSPADFSMQESIFLTARSSSSASTSSLPPSLFTDLTRIPSREDAANMSGGVKLHSFERARGKSYPVEMDIPTSSQGLSNPTSADKSPSTNVNVSSRPVTNPSCAMRFCGSYSPNDADKLPSSPYLKEPATSSRVIYPYYVLKENAPPDVDSSCKEVYLSDIEFFKVFSMTRDEFLELEEGERRELKKEANLL